jgi:hypothetical protein
MNGTGLFVVTILIAVLIAVAFGGSQIQADLNNQITQMTDQRDITLQEALEAKGQRDTAVQDRDVAVAALDTATGRIAELETAQNKIALDLTSSQKTVEEQRREIDQLKNEKIALQTKLDQAQASVVLPGVPDTGGQVTVPQVAETTGTAEKAICLPVRADNLPNQLGTGLALLIGMVALGSGGYIFSRSDSTRKYAVKMTKEQIRDYARYQRERGNQ